MKKSFIIATLMLFATLTASAQYKDFYFGLKTGTDLQWVGSSTKTVHNDKVKMGFNVGFVAEYYFVENYALEFGLNLNLLRNRYEYEEERVTLLNIAHPAAVGLPSNIDTLWGEVNRTVRGTYFEIPLMLKMRTNEFGDWRFFGEVGFSVGVRAKVSAKDIFEYDDEDNPELKPLHTIDPSYSWQYPQDDNDAKFVNVTKQYNPITAKYIIAGGAEYSINGTTRAFARLVFSGNMLNNLSLKYKKKSFGEGPNVPYEFERLEKDRLDVHPYSLGLEIGIMF